MLQCILYTNNPLKSYYADNLLKKKIIKQKQEMQLMCEPCDWFARAHSIRVSMVT